MKTVILIALLLIPQLIMQAALPVHPEPGAAVTKNTEFVAVISKAAAKLPLIKMDTTTRTREGKIVPVLMISKGKFGADPGKIKVMIFAGQHGNEHSGMEACLLFISDIAAGRYNYLFNRIDLVLVPQMNPDGSDKDKRVNGAGADLNRNHLTLTEPETERLHQIFNIYKPEATLDIHEYNPYSSSWVAAGFQKDFDEQVGTLTNLNIDKKLIDYQKKKFLPFIKEWFKEDGFTSDEYTVGGPPDRQRLRYSTMDINDGRQSFGIANTFSFIIEGKSGRTAEDNLQRRALGQYSAIRGFLSFIYKNRGEIRKLVHNGRKNLTRQRSRKTIIQAEHVPDGSRQMRFLSLRTGRDTLVSLNNLHSKAEAKMTVDNPLGYLIEKEDTLLTGLMRKHYIRMQEASATGIKRVSRYRITGAGTDTLEELARKMPVVEKETFTGADLSRYLYIPLGQLNSARIVLMLEPLSMSGLLQYDLFSYMLKPGKNYPVLRAEEVH